MQEYYQEEIEIKELFYFILKKVKVWVLIGLLFALLFAGVKGFSTWRKIDNSEITTKLREEYEEELADYKEQKSILETHINDTEIELAHVREYLKKSYLMEINPFNVYTENLTYYISTNYMIMPDKTYQSPDCASLVLNAYETILTNGAFYEEIDNNYLQELVDIQADKEMLTLSIDIIGKSPEDVGAIVKGIMHEIEKNKAAINDKIGEHEIELVAFHKQSTTSTIAATNKSRIDLLVGQKQKQVKDNVVELEQGLRESRKKLNDLKEPEDNKITKRTVIVAMVKFGLIGLLAGIFLALFSLVVVFSTTNAINNAENLYKRYGYILLSVLAGSSQKGFLNAHLTKIFGKNLVSTYEESVEVIKETLEVLLPEKEPIALVSNSVGVDVTQRLATDLNTALSSRQVVSAGVAWNKSGSLTVLKSSPNVVILVKLGESKTTNVDMLVSYLLKADKQIIGFVAVQ